MPGIHVDDHPQNRANVEGAVTYQQVQESSPWLIKPTQVGDKETGEEYVCEGQPSTFPIQFGCDRGKCDNEGALEHLNDEVVVGGLDGVVDDEASHNFNRKEGEKHKYASLKWPDFEYFDSRHDGADGKDIIYYPHPICEPVQTRHHPAHHQANDIQ